MKHKIYLLLGFLLMMSLRLSADTGWSVNPYDFQYDMTAYVKLDVDGDDAADLGNYEVGAFVGDECRGILDVRSVSGHQYGYIRIRSNNPSGEVVSFRVQDKLTGKELRCGTTLDFVSDTAVGFPSSPFVIVCVNEYRLTYTVDGELYKEYTIDYGTAIIPESEPTKEGHTFSGWDSVPETMPAHDVTVAGTFTVNTYTATFKVGDEVIETLSFDFGQPVVAPEAPAREGHTFAGWQDVPATMPARDIEIQGSYTVNQYTLTYTVDGVAYATYTVEYGTTIVPEAAPTKEGHTFSGWDSVPETMPAHDVTVAGTFTVNTYTATFKVGDEVIATLPLEFGAQVVAPEAPAREGHTFAGWQDVPATMPARDIEIQGSYTVNQYTLTYMVDGETYKVYTIDYGTTIVPEAAPTKEGHTFSGWDSVPETMPANDVTVAGFFTVNTYTATFKVGDEVIATLPFEFGAQVVAPEAPAREGHTFAGWQDVPATMPARDIEIQGSYTVNQYTLTYTVDGVAYATYTVDYGTTIVPEAAPTKEGHTFSGWDSVPETMPAHDVTVAGTFTVNTYTATFKVGDEVIETLSFDFGQPVVAPEAPARAGHTFAGWQDVPATMPARDIEIQGSYTVNQYTLTYMVDGETYKVYTIDYGTTIVPEAAPTKEGHTFSGWDSVPETMPDNDVTVAGSFIVNTYTATFKVGDEVIATLPFEFGAQVVAPEAPAREGHTFAGWQDMPVTMPARDIEIFGSYVSNVVISFSKKQIHLECPEYEGASIRYTTDGRDPSASEGSVYASPFLPAEDCIVKAVAYREGTVTTDVTTYGYVAEEHTVPNIHLVPRYLERGVVMVPETDATVLADSDSIMIAGQPLIKGGDQIGQREFPTEMFGDVAVFEWKSTELLERGPVMMPIEYASVPQVGYDGVTVRISNGKGSRIIYNATYDDGRSHGNEEDINGGYCSFDSESTGQVVIYSYDNGLFRSAPSVFDIHAVRFDADETVMLNKEGWLSQAFGTGEAQDWQTLSVIGPDSKDAPMGTQDFNVIASLGSLRHIDLSATIPVGGSVADFSDLKDLMSLSMPGSNSYECDWNLSRIALLSAIKWNMTSPMTSELFAQMTNRHAIVYVADPGLAPDNAVNVVSNGYAGHLTLSHEYPFCLIDEFTVGEAVFTKNFSKTTVINTSYGWETMVLPFDVDQILQKDGIQREILPFKAIDREDKETAGFWLSCLNENGSGWVDVDHIESGVPYIIAMPNNREYIEEFNIRGEVDFIGHNVLVSDFLTVPVLKDADGNDRGFHGSFIPVGSSDHVFALTEYSEGSVFAPASGDVRPFECWFDGTPGMMKIGIGGNFSGVETFYVPKTGIRIWQEGETVRLTASDDMTTGIIDMTGATLRTVSLKAGEITSIDGLAPGLYIMAGRKILVK